MILAAHMLTRHPNPPKSTPPNPNPPRAPRFRIAAESRSPSLRSAEENWSILHRTGPHVWTDSVLKWSHGAGVGIHEGLQPGGRLVGANARLMPAETFGCAAHFFSNETKLEEVYVMHMFRGVWRKKLGAGPGWQAGTRQQGLGF